MFQKLIDHETLFANPTSVQKIFDYEQQLQSIKRS